jgi:hypothetical protein
MSVLQYLYTYTRIRSTNHLNITKTGSIYYIKIITPEVTVYKIGATCRDIITRVNEFKLKANTAVYLIDSISNIPVNKVYRFEQILHKKYRTPTSRYTKTNILDSGNSEVYRYDILKIDNALNKSIIRLDFIPIADDYAGPTRQQTLPTVHKWTWELSPEERIAREEEFNSKYAGR